MLSNYFSLAMAQLFAGTVLAYPFRPLRVFNFARNICAITRDGGTRPCDLRGTWCG